MAPGVSRCHFDVSPSISFSGSGFLVTYHLGVTQCFLNNAPRILHTAPFVLGASAGSLAAASVVCEISPISIRDEILYFVKQLKAFTLGPFNPSINVLHWLELVLNKHLPSNAHKLASGRLAVAMTRMADNKLIIMSDFESKEDVLQALLCSCFVPGYCGMSAPSIKGVHYVDGGFNSMQPVLPLPHSKILRVCPFSGEMDICPADAPSMLDMVVSGTTLKGNIANSIRVINALYPMASETLEQAYDSGYKDAIHFLQSNNLVHVTVVHETFQGTLNGNKNKSRVHLEMDAEKEEGTRKEKGKPSLPFTDLKCKQKDSSTVEESKGKHSIHFDMTRKVLLCNMISYMTMFGLPARILSCLFLPFLQSYYSALKSRQRLVMSLKQITELFFWTWQCLRYFTIFTVNIFICSLMHNLKDRVMPFILLFKWIKIHLLLEMTQEFRKSQSQNFSSSVLFENVSRDYTGNISWIMTNRNDRRSKRGN